MPLISIKNDYMLIKDIKPINFLFFRTETTIAELHQHLVIAPQLFQEAVACKLWITGPVHWHYIGFTGDYSQPFTLEISLPVSAIPDGYVGRFHFKRTELFKCVSAMHEGDWTKMGDAYAQVMTYISNEKLTTNGVNRELYINVDFEDLDANSTEIQIGIK